LAHFFDIAGRVKRFSVDAGVCIEAHDRAALQRLLRYCARPPFAVGRLRKEGAALVYRSTKQHSEPGSDKRAAKADELQLTPLELIARIAALVPPAQPAKEVVVQTEPATMGEGVQIRKILDHIGMDSEPPQISPARGPPLWDDCDAQTGDGVHMEPDWDLAPQAAPGFEVDQRVSC